MVRQVVLNNVNQDTFGDYLDVASSRRLQRLEAKCIDFLLTNFERVGAHGRSRTCTCTAIRGADEMHAQRSRTQRHA